MDGTSTPRSNEQGPPLRYFAVTYPGVVKNGGKAVRLLGGLKKLGEDMLEGRPLELKPVPENSYHRSSWGQKVGAKDNVVNIVIRCKRRRRKTTRRGSDGREVVSYGDWSSSSRVEGLLETQYNFKGFADFQFLPIRTVDGESGERLERVQDVRGEVFPSSMAAALDWLSVPSSSASASSASASSASASSSGESARTAGGGEGRRMEVSELLAAAVGVRAE